MVPSSLMSCCTVIELCLEYHCLSVLLVTCSPVWVKVLKHFVQNSSQVIMYPEFNASMFIVGGTQCHWSSM